MKAGESSTKSKTSTFNDPVDNSDLGSPLETADSNGGKSGSDVMEPKSSSDGLELGQYDMLYGISSLIELNYKYLRILKLFSAKCTWILALNIITLIMLDVFIGTLLSMYLQRLISSYTDYENVCKIVLELLLKLLDWLSGAPAGLKLNAELNSLFHSFYSYHLHLWEGYMDLVKPLLKLLFDGFVKLGFLGLTIQLALAKDLLSLTTFHIYCLYIYATRLFYIELNTLKSLGRLIMGRKWNPLRKRIDSVTLSVSELFLGSFGFTVALFLLPTICIYYIVFLALRLPIVLTEILLKFCLQLFNSLEIITAFLVFTNSRWIEYETYFSPLFGQDFQDGCLQYQVKTQPISRKFYQIPQIGKYLIRIIYDIMESKRQGTKAKAYDLLKKKDKENLTVLIFAISRILSEWP